jgi:hypothetical protein
MLMDLAIRTLMDLAKIISEETVLCRNIGTL